HAAQELVVFSREHGSTPSSFCPSLLAILDGRPLDRQELLETDDAQHVLLDRAPVRLALGTGAEAVGELLVHPLPGRIGSQERRARGGGSGRVGAPAGEGPPRPGRYISGPPSRSEIARSCSGVCAIDSSTRSAPAFR